MPQYPVADMLLDLKWEVGIKRISQDKMPSQAKSQAKYNGTNIYIYIYICVCVCVCVCVWVLVVV